MSATFSVSAGKSMEALLVGHETGRDARLNAICADWQHLIAGSVPAFEERHWLALIGITSGARPLTEQAMRLLWETVMRSVEPCIRWGVDKEELLTALRSMTSAQLIALRETIDRTWTAMEAGATQQKALRVAGALPAPAHVDQDRFTEAWNREVAGHVQQAYRDVAPWPTRDLVLANALSSMMNARAG